MDELLAIVRELSLAASQVIEGEHGAMESLTREVAKADDFLDMHDMATNQCAALKEAEEEVINQRGGGSAPTTRKCDHCGADDAPHLCSGGEWWCDTCLANCCDM